MYDRRKSPECEFPRSVYFDERKVVLNCKKKKKHQLYEDKQKNVDT